jgi:hypothetical protein
MKDKIIQLDNVKTFWEDVKKIVGYYDNVFLEDWEIKELQRIADYRYSQLLEKEEC